MKTSLEDRLLLAQLALVIAQARPDALETALQACAQQQVSPEAVDEAILQTIPYSGFPGAVEALGLWRRMRPSAAELQDPADPPGPADEQDQGVAIFRRVYEDLADPVRSELTKRHPALERWVLGFAYGRVMGRGVLELGVLESLGVASLLGQRRHAPLHSHLRGALRNGWSRDELLRLLKHLAPLCDSDTLRFAKRIVDREAPPT